MWFSFGSEEIVMKFLGGIGLGTFPLSNVFSVVDDAAAETLVSAFLDGGGRYIQTAPYYEGVDDRIAKVLKRRLREEYYLCTLCVKNREGLRTGQYNAIIEQCDDSLKHLRVDHIDLFMTSTTKASDAPLDETLGALVDLRKQGKIREIGVSNVTLDDLKQYNNHGDVRFVQNRFSLLNASLTEEFSAYCTQHRIDLIPYQVIERGLLTNQVLEGLNLRAGDLREKKPEFRPEAQRVIRQWVSESLGPIARSLGTTIEALVIWWALHQNNVALCVVGATKASQITHALEAANLPNRPDLLELVTKAYQFLENHVQQNYSKTVQAFLGNVY